MQFATAMASSSLQPHDADFYDMSDESMDEEPTNLNNYMQLLGAIATVRGDGLITSRIFPVDTFSEQPRSTVDKSIDEPEANETEDYGPIFVELHIAAIKGDWERARTFLQSHSANMVDSKISINQLKTVLQLAIGTGSSNHFVEKLLEYMAPSDLATPEYFSGETPLNVAATVGNLKAAKLLVKKNPDLPHIHVFYGGEIALPLHRAIQYNHKQMVLYLLEVMNRDGSQPSAYDGESGVAIPILLVIAGFYDVALHLLKKNPGMGSQVYLGETPLSILAVKPFDFPSGCGFNVWERVVYSCVPPRFGSYTMNQRRPDSENPPESTDQVQAQTTSCLRSCGSYAWQKLLISFWEITEKLVPRVKHIRDIKVKHHQVLEIVRELCSYAAGLEFSQAAALLRGPLHLAAEFGVPEIIEEIAELLPYEVWRRDSEGRGVLQLAVMNRREKVFNLLYLIKGHRYYMIEFVDNMGNNLLHLAGHLAPPHQLNLVSGAALQMQRELQWYKRVENLVPPTFKEMKNFERKKPRTVFTEAHKNLVIEGEKWMKDTANSCTVVAALIATVVFAAAITVPGGNADSGSPIFFNEKAFIIFAVSDALSLFSSTAAIFMFMSILTARYAQEDFLHALPKRLIMGLLTLFISITSMMIAFSSTLYLVFGQDKTWILASVAGSACLLVALFVHLQFPLLLDIINATYGSGNFAKQREPRLYD